MPDPVLAIVGSSLGSSVLASAGANKAVDAQSRATDIQAETTDKQIALYERIFDQQFEAATPWRDVGADAIRVIGEGIKSGRFSMADFDFTADPGYQFRKAEGEKAIDRIGAAGGNFLSGQQIKRAMEFNQNFAANEYDRAYSREAGEKTRQFNFLAGASGAGQVANREISANADALGARSGSALGVQGAAASQGAANIGAIQQNMYGNIATAGNQGIENYLLYKGLG